MNRSIKIKKLVMAAVLTAIAIIIPVQFGFLKVVIPPFTATIGSHIPMFLAMLISPYVAIVVGLGSALGFLLAGLPPFVAARALMHVPVGYIGSIIMRKTGSYKKSIAFTAIIHGLLEAIVVIPFGFDFYQSLVVVGIGTVLHHLVDGGISYWLNKSMTMATKKDIFKEYNKDLVA